ncbi:FMN-binding glutamate synthase family protein [Sinimarinibacterium sp. NLF-5-8]|uniref:FMN-binding glutamate synthase family protein n=1 Tax=Sinimarinibacterium sp. NLF-5-8 TaxID=2698684 RepID=UPI00137C36B8|nr:FMN-binding glutamate synthase family protein [Sinimarinibacterium sp. NLF-5-8]QHS09645.1 FMN-binding glutamate synthase family protein [Sinimarinibacterium sp. NLF-5-8]
MHIAEEKPTRYLAFAICIALFLAGLVLLAWWPRIGGILALIFGLLTAIGIHDVTQSSRAILRNYPILAHIRFFMESIRPEIRQYLLESDTDEAPFSREQRSLVYQRAKSTSDVRPYGSLINQYKPDHEWVNHSMMATHLAHHDFRVTIGADQCAQPYAASLFNISAMSFGALSANAIRALNQAARKGNFAHDTGEGSISPYHREHGGDLIWEIGTGYFGCRTAKGEFDAQKFIENARLPQVRMIEIKVSQGAKPGHGGILPGSKVTAEIASTRGVPEGEDCISPPRHSAFATPLEMLEFIDKLRELSGGKPVGFKFCFGHPWEFFAICKAMVESGRHPDFIVVDGAEGGTGAAPVEFANHVGTPLQEGLSIVHNTLIGLNLRDKIKLGASGKIVSAYDMARTLALGADWCNSARGFMFSVGCIMAQVCNTGRCPTGVATQDPLRQRALVVPDKAERAFNFHQNTLKALAELTGAAGLTDPNQIRPKHIIRRISSSEVRLMSTVMHGLNPGDLLEGRAKHPLYTIYWPMARSSSFDPA